jgi:hypothetical protein
MLSVTCKPHLLSVVMLNVAMLSVVLLSVMAPFKELIYKFTQVFQRH